VLLITPGLRFGILAGEENGCNFMELSKFEVQVAQVAYFCVWRWIVQVGPKERGW
jgi:hypothetical protein